MTINVIDQSETYLAGWSVKKGMRYITAWLSVADKENIWFKQQMVSRFGEDWDNDQD